jgi:putative redox protein
MEAKKLNMRVSGNGKGMQTVLKAGNHTVTIDEPPAMGGQDSGPDPLTTLLSALAGCENVVANMVAKEMEFDLQGIEFDIKGVLDPRGFMGDPNVRTYFEKVTIQAKVKTSESEERIKELQTKTDSRCPVYNTLKAADVEIETNWTKA